jgi:acyl-coenzyme A synthetase/AMP-(fatty) acid ligase
MSNGEQSHHQTHALSSLTARALMREENRPAIEFGRRWFNWGEIRHVADRVGALMAASGAAPGAPVALVARNRPAAVAALLGLLAKGHTIRMIYAFQSPAAIARDVDRLNPAAVIAGATEFSDELGAVLHKRGIAGIALEEMDARCVSRFERANSSDIDIPLEPRIEILTSGTTGPPKHFAVTYDLIAKHHVGAGSLHSGEDPEQQRLYPAILFFPLGNISGIYSTIPTMLRGRRALLLDRFNIPDWHDYVLRFRPESGGLPPAGVQMVLDANIPAADLACIRYLSTGAAPLDPTAQRAFEERYGIPILLSYGATEFGGPVAAMTAELYPEWGQKKFGTVGRPLPGAQLRVIDPSTGSVLPPGAEGILEVICARIGPDWIRTADVAVIDEDGFLFHRGRADGAIMRGGFKLLPESIERALVLHEAISAAGVVGIADKRLGQVPAAVIQLKPGCTEPTIAQLEAHLRNELPATHIPVAWRFVASLPRNRSVKVDRPALRQLFESESHANLG